MEDLTQPASDRSPKWIIATREIYVAISTHLRWGIGPSEFA